MSEYETKVLIDELQKLVVAKTIENSTQNAIINHLKKEIERLEHLLTPKVETKK